MRFVVLVLLFGLSLNTFAMRATTVGGNVACLSEAWFESLARFFGFLAIRCRCGKRLCRACRFCIAGRLG